MTKRENQILEKVLDLLKKYLKPSKVILFGSRSKGHASISSDFDFAVQCKIIGSEIKRKLKEKIEEVSGLYHVDIVYWNEINEDFRKIILASGKVIYERRA